MEALGRYILSVTAASMIVGILLSLLREKGSHAQIVRLIGGLFLVFSVIRPLAGVNVDTLFDLPVSFASDGQFQADSGRETASAQMEQLITRECCAYILDKAKAYQLQLEVEVTLSQDALPVPVGVRLKGSVSPFARQRLQQYIQEDLGIPEENQIWIG